MKQKTETEHLGAQKEGDTEGDNEGDTEIQRDMEIERQTEINIERMMQARVGRQMKGRIRGAENANHNMVEEKNRSISTDVYKRFSLPTP